MEMKKVLSTILPPSCKRPLDHRQNGLMC